MTDYSDYPIGVTREEAGAGLMHREAAEKATAVLPPELLEVLLSGEARTAKGRVNMSEVRRRTWLTTKRLADLLGQAREALREWGVDEEEE